MNWLDKEQVQKCWQKYRQALKSYVGKHKPSISVPEFCVDVNLWAQLLNDDIDRKWLEKYIKTKSFLHIVVAAIVINSITLGLMTIENLSSTSYYVLSFIDAVCIMIFAAEVSARIYIEGRSFFSNGWDVFDFTIVVISIIAGEAEASVLRVLRVFRIMHLVYEMPVLRNVLRGFIAAVPQVQSAIFLLGIIFYASSIMATAYFGDAFPDWFGSIGKSAYSLFQIMTLESWSMGIVRPIMSKYPYAWMFFIPFIVFTTYIILNLFVGIIVSAIQSSQDHESYELEEGHNKKIVTLYQLKKHLDKLEKEQEKLVSIITNSKNNKSSTKTNTTSGKAAKKPKKQQ